MILSTKLQALTYNLYKSLIKYFDKLIIKKLFYLQSKYIQEI